MTALRSCLACLLTLSLLAAACDGGGEPALCEPGETRDCPCEPGRLGEQACAEDGRSWEACDCACTPDCSGKACGPDGCGGSCGACDSPPAPTCADGETLVTPLPGGACVDGACQYVPSRSRCEFGCADGVCNLDPCVNMRCDQPDACHTNPGTCVAAPELHCVYPAIADGTACEDGLFCNGAESCQAGACVSAGAVDCSGLDEACRAGVCDEDARACDRVDLADGAACEDGLFCDGAEYCLAGVCQAGAPVDCSAIDGPCSLGVCDEERDRCRVQARNEGLPCPDGLVCNGQELCGSGQCRPGTPLECPDLGIACQQNTCAEAAGGCQLEAVADDSPCATGSPCALAESCQSGACVATEAQPDGTVCSDGDRCTSGDSCLAGACAPGVWTCTQDVVIMMYLDADNNLDEWITGDWHEMEAAGIDSVEWLEVYVVIDHSGTNDTRFYQVHSNSSTRLAGPAMGLTANGNQELDMSNPDTLRHFIEDVKALTQTGRPTDYYLLLSDHGDGWRRQRAMEQPGVVRAACCDDTNGGGCMYTSEIGDAIAGQDLTLLAFDACLMGMAEVAYEVKDDVEVMVASQETEPGEGWNYTPLLQQFKALADPTPEAFGQLAADTYFDLYDASYSDLTMAVYDLAGMEALAAAADPAATGLQAMSSATWTQLCNPLEFYGCFWGWCSPHADIQQIMTQAKLRDPAHTAEYDAFIAAVQDVVLYELHRSGHSQARGMNVYFPCEDSFDSAYNTTNLRWAADTTWETMLQVH
ncbi:MAG TPA: clostripain-related cysteine peptidase [Myxococcota bacterium]|nr:clostripain-related cysteine peptidase [Myxococcota bacterium]HRY95450.1 clostripain-related cysteine peptidase [Myxococcota bacterium]HSA23440.1 clostripain-related cysteine peptidase [Myxococcota bacterium]